MFGTDNVQRYNFGSLYASDIEGAQPRKTKRNLMTNAGGHVLSNIDAGHIYPYMRLPDTAHDIYLKHHMSTFNNVFGPQVTQDALEKQFTKKSCEWSIVNRKNNQLQRAETNNPQEYARQPYGWDSVDALQTRMSEGNLNSKIKKEVYNFYGMDPPPTGNPSREKLS